ncbi:hypothetical protein GALMADRAFT_69917 [Galerina marginata CBS 339.88]|uniref:J domain-containing protein n=1 Tax=Galerina marginata (strain CBS 339.88) TaxID=685588 RepID=A0A067T563_GALM3|nr:hypothetical protein GALMADRAFT_69917 [Galerina marginata CBS 339.88]
MSRALANFTYWATTSQCRRIPSLSKRNYHTATEEGSTNPSSNHNPFPYPSHRNPTPHQLFHLPVNATKAEIKARYYDLVRHYHPDKVGESTDSSTALARFRAITAAYDTLRGKTPHNHNASTGSSNLEARYRTTAAYRAMRQKRQELYESGAVDDTRTDKLLIAGVIFTIVFVLYHTLTTRRAALADAMDRSRRFAASRQHSEKPTEDHRLSQDCSQTPNTTP